jgi:hypothetical protein
MINPGSNEAIAQGCTCPVLDNAHGKGCGYIGKDGNPLYWTNENCPLHGNQSSKWRAYDPSKSGGKSGGKI